MQLYWPQPTPPGVPNDCFHCGVEIDGDDVEGIWLERERWQQPNTHELTCLSCCIEKLNDGTTQLTGDDADEMMAQLS